MKRRDFFKTAAICGVAGTLSTALGQERSTASQEDDSMKQIPLTRSAETRKGDMLYRTLGSTGEKVSAIGMGGFHIAKHGLTDEQSIQLVRSAIDRDITFLDNSWEHNEGQSEILMGKALKDGYRQKVFLMTKIDGLRRPRKRASEARGVQVWSGLARDDVQSLRRTCRCLPILSKIVVTRRVHGYRSAVIASLPSCCPQARSRDGFSDRCWIAGCTSPGSAWWGFFSGPQVAWSN